MPDQSHYVLDTSVLAKFFFVQPDHKKAKRILELAVLEQLKLFIPTLALYELNNVLIVNHLSDSDAEKARNTLFCLIEGDYIEVVDASPAILQQAYAIANQGNPILGHISTYDATFHAIAILKNAVFITADKKYVRKIKDSDDSLQLLENWSESSIGS